MELENVQSVLSMIRVGGLLTAGAILVCVYFVGRFVTATFHRLGERLTERRLLLQQVASFVRFGIYFGGISLAAASALELRQETVLALSGTAGIALGFALKDLASSVLAGLTILIDKPFRVGDRIQFGDVYGDVTAIGLRSVQIATLDDNLVTIPNNRFLSESVASANAGELHMLVQQDFFIGLDQDVDGARRIVEEVLTSSAYIAIQRPWTVLVTQVVQGDTFALRLRAKAYVLDTHYEKAFESDVHQRVLTAFQAAGVLPPARYVRLSGTRFSQASEGSHDDTTLARNA